MIGANRPDAGVSIANDSRESTRCESPVPRSRRPTSGLLRKAHVLENVETLEILGIFELSVPKTLRFWKRGNAAIVIPRPKPFFCDFLRFFCDFLRFFCDSCGKNCDFALCDFRTQRFFCYYAFEGR